MQQAADDSAEEEHGDEDGHQRQRHGDDGEADLVGRGEGRLAPRLTHFHVAHDVLEHHDGVVHHEADRRFR